LLFGKQCLCVIGWFSPFLRSSSGKKSRSRSNYQPPEATSSGKVYFTQCCISWTQAAWHNENQLVEINPGGGCSIIYLYGFK